MVMGVRYSSRELPSLLPSLEEEIKKLCAINAKFLNIQNTNTHTHTKTTHKHTHSHIHTHKNTHTLI